jgi:hypothetical protein
MPHIQEEEIHAVELVPPHSSPNYNKDNPVTKLIAAVEAAELSAERHHYLADSIQYLFPFARASLYGPAGEQWQVRDPRLQDDKNDFQKQNVSRFDLADTQLFRGYAQAGDWCGSFLHISYSPGLTSPIAAGGLYRGSHAKLFLRIGSASTGGTLLDAPYNEVTHRYEIELWAYTRGAQELRSHLGAKGRDALSRGELVSRADLVKGALDEFQGAQFDALRDAQRRAGQALLMFDYAPDHSMHPVRPLRVEFAWRSQEEDRWDSLMGRNYRHEFAMVMRGWRNYLGVGQSANPHGGVGLLEYRNLFSNYFSYEARRREVLGDEWLSELGRELHPWNIDAYGNKPPIQARELFMPVNYMDLHVLKPSCAIGIHRHRDNLEAFLMLHGKALMVTGDWCKFDQRERAFEVRTMQPGDLVLIKGGQFHGLINSLDENVKLFMFGGYD